MSVSVAEVPYQPDSAVLFQAIAREDWPVWLDSGSHFPGHQVDVLAANPAVKLIYDPDGTSSDTETNIDKDATCCNSIDDAFRLIQSTLDQFQHQQSYGPGWLGYLSYDLFSEFEPVAQREKSSLIPKLVLGFYGVVIVNNHQTQKTLIYSVTGQQAWADALYQQLGNTRQRTQPAKSLPEFSLTSTFAAHTPPDQYQRQFEQVKDYILEGDCYQVNLTQAFSAECSGVATQAYLSLRASHPSPMSAYFYPGEFEILSLSPERFVQKQGARIASYPIKGTRPRSTDKAKDNALKQALSQSQKDRAENVMIVDLLRNDLGRICKTGSVKTTQLFNVESFPNVHHLVSTVEGQLKSNTPLLRIFQAIFPGGSITGAPKIRAMEIIEELEEHRRGIYCGSMVYFGGNGDFDSNIAIRTLLRKGHRIHCWGGGGIVADSQCDNEYQETLDKVGRLMAILEESFGPEA